MEKEKEIIIARDYIWITPIFFLKNYDSNDLSDTEIYNSCCRGMGVGNGGFPDNYNYRLANAFISKSAKLYIGMFNDVVVHYSSNFINSFIEKRELGGTFEESFLYSVNLNGSHYASTYPVLVTKDLIYTLDLSVSNESIRVFPNDKEGLIKKDKKETVKNNSMEDNVPGTNNIINWKTDGDIRAQWKMGEVEPPDGSAYALVGTGIGEASDKMETKNSSLSQRMRIPDNATTLTFQYNFISEEPMEWIGYRWGPLTYDDTFSVTINRSKWGYIDTTEKVQLQMGYVPSGSGFNDDVLLEQRITSVYPETWTRIYGIDFQGGDDTVYQTGWRSASVDVSGLRGETVIVNFVVQDVGDLLYHSAVLIDNVEIA